MGITKALHGKTVHLAHVVDHTLIIQCEDGTEVHIEWQGDAPVMVRQNVSILIPLPPDVLGRVDMGA
jgi:hypothetical protein